MQRGFGPTVSTTTVAVPASAPAGGSATAVLASAPAGGYDGDGGGNAGICSSGRVRRWWRQQETSALMLAWGSDGGGERLQPHLGNGGGGGGDSEGPLPRSDDVGSSDGERLLPRSGGNGDHERLRVSSGFDDGRRSTRYSAFVLKLWVAHWGLRRQRRQSIWKAPKC